MESAITVKGQATIPKAIREHLRLKPGDRVKFFVHPDGKQLSRLACESPGKDWGGQCPDWQDRCWHATTCYKNEGIRARRKAVFVRMNPKSSSARHYLCVGSLGAASSLEAAA
jgi:AbrB family looped-hinge helix DNA binding protein